MKIRFRAAKLVLVLFAAALVCGSRTEEIAPPDKSNVDAQESDLQTATTTDLQEKAPPPEELEPVKKTSLAPAKLSVGLEDIIKLAESGADESVLLSYVENSSIAYSLSADEIVYLRDVGVPEAVITAMIKRGAALREKQGIATPPKPESETTTLAKAEPNQPAPEESLVVEVPQNPPPTYAQGADQVTVPPAADQPAVVNYFYGSLAPYGSWYDLPGYGYCWQPQVAAFGAGWSPYCNSGRWLYSNAGWYWHSTYSWGWGPFHYGRWWCHPRSGWLWFPGSVWAPAWVTWRTHNSYCGWAPIPPPAICGRSSFAVGVGFGLGPARFTFVDYKHFLDRDVRRHHLRPGQVTQVFNNTTVINNISRGNNNVVINKGVGVERIAQLTRSEIPKVEVRDVPRMNGIATKPVDRLERSGNSIVAYRQPLSQPPPRTSALVPAASLSRRSTTVATQTSPISSISDTRSSSVAVITRRSELPSAKPAAPTPQLGAPALNNASAPVGGVSATPRPNSGPVVVTRPNFTQPTPTASIAVPQNGLRPASTVNSGPVNKPVVERGTQRNNGSQPVYAAPQPSATRPPTVNVPQASPSVSGPRSQPIIVGRSTPAPQSVPNYSSPPRAQSVPQATYRAPIQSVPQVVTPSPRPSYSAPAAQSAAPRSSAPIQMRSAPVQSAPRPSAMQTAPSRATPPPSAARVDAGRR